MRVLITNGYIVYYFNVVAFKTEIYDDVPVTGASIMYLFSFLKVKSFLLLIYVFVLHPASVTHSWQQPGSKRFHVG